MPRLFSMLAPALLLLGAAAPPAPATLPANYVHVSAPLAQRLVVQAMASGSGISKIGLHATPDGAGANAIIAADNPAKIGKKSSLADLEHLATGRPFVTRIDKEGIYDLLLPITDRNGRSIGEGFVVMEVPIASVADETAALAVGTAVRDRLQRAIPSKAALYHR